MKKQIFNSLIIFAIALTIVSCKKKADEAKTGAAEEAAVSVNTSDKYIANAEESTIAWKGFKPTGTHNGTISISTGFFNSSNGKIESGTFLIDMNSITEAEDNQRLVGHLKSADFFDVENHKSAAFEITGLEEKDGKTMLSGNLSMKDVKNNISFPVTVSNDGDTMTLTSETFTIDRSKWNVQYGSKSFFDDLGDKFINDDIELTISVKATKKS